MKKNLLLYAGIIVGLLVLSYAYVPQVLSGKIVNQSDISGWQGMSHEMMEWNAAHPDDQTAWTESMFGGMPTATIHASTRGDWTQQIYDFLLTGRRPATYLFISLLGAWLLMLSLGIHPLLAVGGAIAVTFCSYNLQIIQVGHNTKMQALAFLPWVLAALVYTYNQIKKDRWLPGAVLGAALFGLALSFQVKANHPQITYYLALLILIYVIVLVVSIWRKGLWGRFFAASALLLVLAMALGHDLVEIYAGGDSVELLQNGKSLGKKPCGAGNSFFVQYDTVYEPGLLEAVVFEKGKEISRGKLETTDEVTDLSLKEEKGEALSFISIELQDEKGRRVFGDEELSIELSGGELLAFGSEKTLHDRGFTRPVCKAADGEALAVIRRMKGKELKITVSCGKTQGTVLCV